MRTDALNLDLLSANCAISISIEERNLNYVAGPLTIALDVDSRMLSIRHHRKFSTLFHKSIINLLLDENFLNLKLHSEPEFIPIAEYFYLRVELSDRDFITVLTNEIVYLGDSELIFSQK